MKKFLFFCIFNGLLVLPVFGSEKNSEKNSVRSKKRKYSNDQILKDLKQIIKIKSNKTLANVALYVEYYGSDILKHNSKNNLEENFYELALINSNYAVANYIESQLIKNNTQHDNVLTNDFDEVCARLANNSVLATIKTDKS